MELTLHNTTYVVPAEREALVREVIKLLEVKPAGPVPEVPRPDEKPPTKPVEPVNRQPITAVLQRQPGGWFVLRLPNSNTTPSLTVGSQDISVKVGPEKMLGQVLNWYSRFQQGKSTSISAKLDGVTYTAQLDISGAPEQTLQLTATSEDAPKVVSVGNIGEFKSTAN
ncbi:hypothetical protein GCM10028807_57680 [Spirosoma daeguense]